MRIITPIAACVAFLLAATAAQAQPPAELLKTTGVTGGIVVQLNSTDAEELASLLGPSGRFLVQGLATDPSDVQQLRNDLRTLGVHGDVSAVQYDGKTLPYADNTVNVLVGRSPISVTRDELLRVLTPNGIAMIGSQRLVKPVPEATDEWTHFLYDGSNNAVSHDLQATQPRSIQWVAAPYWGRSHEELASMSATVSTGGRIFSIIDEAPLDSINYTGQWKLVARDAYNGKLLWKRDIAGWTDHLRHFRSGPVQLPRRLVAIGDTVYVTLGLDAPITAIDAATGQTKMVYEGTEFTEEILVDDGVMYIAAGTSETKRKGGGLFTRGEPGVTDFRYVAAIDVTSGKLLWKNDMPKDAYLLPLTIAAKDGVLAYQTSAGVTCVDAKSGEIRWRTPRPTPLLRMSFSAPTLVITDDVVLSADRDVTKDAAPATEEVDWGVHGWNEPGYPRKGPSTLRAYAITDGEELWSVPVTEGYNSPTDLFVVGDTVWAGANFKGYNLLTGEPHDPITWSVGSVAMAHHRCYRNKATENYLLTGRAGIEFVSFEDGWVGNNSWIRGTCQYGIMPANGLIYAPPNACACVAKAKVAGFFAAAPSRVEGGITFGADPLEIGPAYGKIVAKPDCSGDWPMYRGDTRRTGATQADIPTKLNVKWEAELGGTLTQAVTAQGKTFVASKDDYTVFALDSQTGDTDWTYTVGGRIDSAPTIYGGLVLFGSADGWVYALRASDGVLAWRFRAAPQEKLVGAFDRLESVWPVHGSVLVQNGDLYFTAGRSTFLDGGIVVYRLDPMTGEVLARVIHSSIDPVTNKQTAYEDKGKFKFDVGGATTDLLTGDGESIYMKQFRFNADGERQDTNRPHLFSMTGMVIPDWFVRTYWLLGTDTGAGWGGWARAADTAVSGRILSFGPDSAFGYGRVQVKAGPVGHRANEYHLFRRALPESFLDQELPTPEKAGSVNGVFAETKGDIAWSDGQAPIVKGMVLSPTKLAVAGVPALGKKDEAILAFTNEPEALAALHGRLGGVLQVRNSTDGSVMSEMRLPTAPMLDGMSAAGGKLFISMQNGKLVCLGE